MVCADSGKDVCEATAAHWRRRSYGRGGEAGLSAVELAVFVAISAILLSSSVVAFNSARARYQLRQEASSLAWQIERARSVAIRLNRTLRLGFTNNKSFGLTCTDCPEASSELPPITISRRISLSEFPSLTVRGNGTITATSPVITISSDKGLQITVTVSNSGRATVGDVSEATRDY